MAKPGKMATEARKKGTEKKEERRNVKKQGAMNKR